MTRLRRIVATVAVASFAAGVGTGLVLPRVAEQMGDPEPLTPDQTWMQTYMRNFRVGYAPTAAQEADVQAILLQYLHDKASILTQANPDLFPPAVSSELRRAGRRMDQRIEFVLDEQQRAKYGKATAPVADEGGQARQEPSTDHR